MNIHDEADRIIAAAFQATGKADVLAFERLEVWAEGKQPDEPVGLSSNLSGCPIAAYLNAVLPPPAGTRTWEVNGTQAILFTLQGFQLDAITLATWLHYVVGRVDRHRDQEPITAAEFLRILREVRDFAL